MSIHDDIRVQAEKARQTLNTLKARLDIDQDSDIDADDLVAAVRKYEAVKIALAVIVGVVIGAVAF